MSPRFKVAEIELERYFLDVSLLDSEENKINILFIKMFVMPYKNIFNSIPFYFFIAIVDRNE